MANLGLPHPGGSQSSSPWANTDLKLSGAVPSLVRDEQTQPRILATGGVVEVEEGSSTVDGNNQRKAGFGEVEDPGRPQDSVWESFSLDEKTPWARERRWNWEKHEPKQDPEQMRLRVTVAQRKRLRPRHMGIIF